MSLSAIIVVSCQILSDSQPCMSFQSGSQELRFHCFLPGTGFNSSSQGQGTEKLHIPEHAQH